MIIAILGVGLMGGSVGLAALERRLQHPRRGVVAADLGAEPLARGEPDGPAHESDAEDADDQLRTAESALPATAAARSTCST